MESTGALAEFGQRFSSYLPTLTGGLVVFALGIAVGWVAKRIVVRVLIWLRLDRLGGQLAWRAAFAKGDVRAALYDLAGSAAMTLVILVFLDNALEIWGLTVLSRAIDRGLTYLPNLFLTAIILGVGLGVANVAAGRVESALEEEGVPSPRLVARALKAALLAIVGALGLWQLDFAREIVMAAFIISFGAAGVAFAVAVGLGSARAIQHGWEVLFEKRKGD